MGETGAAVGGGTKLGLVSLTLSLVLGCLVTAAFFYLQLSVRTENSALRARIDALDRQLAALGDAVVELNNKTQELIRKREEDQRHAYKEEDDVEVEAEYEDVMDTEYDDPNEEDDSEYDEDEEYDHAQPKEAITDHTHKEDRRSKRAASEIVISPKKVNRTKHSGSKALDSFNRVERVPRDSHVYKMMKRLRTENPTDILTKNSMKRMDEIFQPRYPVIHRSRRNNKREEVEIFTQNLSPSAAEPIAAHYGADETKCLNQPHLRHCEKNHRRYHPGGVIKDWNNILSTSSTLNFKDGKLTVNSAGLYFVYAQRLRRIFEARDSLKAQKSSIL